MEKIIFSKNVIQALTTSSYGKHYKCPSCVEYLDKGVDLLSKMLRAYVIGQREVPRKKAFILIGYVTANAILAAVLDTIVYRYNIKIRDNHHVQIEKISERARAEVLRALFYAVFIDQQEGVFNYILDEIKSRMTFELNHYHQLEEIIRNAEGKDITEYCFTEELIPKYFTVTLKYQGKTVVATNRDVKIAMFEACKKWFQ